MIFRKCCNSHCVKNALVLSTFGPYFPAFELHISQNSVRIREEMAQKNSEHGHFSRSVHVYKNCSHQTSESSKFPNQFKLDRY